MNRIPVWIVRQWRLLLPPADSVARHHTHWQGRNEAHPGNNNPPDVDHNPRNQQSAPELRKKRFNADNDRRHQHAQIVQTARMSELPFDTDAALFESIGAGNIQCGMIDVVPDGMPTPIVVQLKQVTLIDAIEVLGRMGILELEAKACDDTYVVALNDKVESYTAALVYRNGVLADTIELRE